MVHEDCEFTWTDPGAGERFHALLTLAFADIPTAYCGGDCCTAGSWTHRPDPVEQPRASKAEACSDQGNLLGEALGQG